MTLFSGFSRASLLVIVAAVIYVPRPDTASAQSRERQIDIDSRADRFLPKITETTSPPVRPPAATRTLSPAERSGANIFLSRLLPVQYVKKKPEQPEAAWKATTSFVSEPELSFETNATNSKNDREADTSATVSGGFETVFPLEGNDRLTLLMSSTSTRYSRLTDLDFDAALVQAVYGHVLSRDQGSNKTTSGKTVIEKNLSLGIEAKSYHERNYGSLIENYVTPTIAFKHKNFWHSDTLCGKTKGDESFCHAATLSLAARFNGAGTPRAQYAALKLGIESATQMATEGMVLKASGSVDFRDFVNYSGGRQDARFTVGARIDWDVSDQLTLSAGMSFIYHTSTVAASEWNGFSMGPSAALSIKLN